MFSGDFCDAALLLILLTKAVSLVASIMEIKYYAKIPLIGLEQFLCLFWSLSSAGFVIEVKSLKLCFLVYVL